MKTNTNSRYAVAVLIDGDNASFEKMEDIMGFVSRYGDAVVRRIYGDWTRKALSAWKETAREHGFRLVQASSHASGKNTTDIALVIDAMDILRDGRADCFCLVASDGDYSLLAQRIREAGLKVLGYGGGQDSRIAGTVLFRVPVCRPEGKQGFGQYSRILYPKGHGVF